MKKYTGKTSTAIIPFSENRLLLIKRNTIPFKGYWALPGGRKDQGETIEDTIVREVKEETGLDVTIVSRVGEYVEKGQREGVEYEYYPTCFVVKPVGGKVLKQDSEIQEIKAFNLDSLPKPLAFEHEKMIEDWLHPKKSEVKP